MGPDPQRKAAALLGVFLSMGNLPRSPLTKGFRIRVGRNPLSSGRHVPTQAPSQAEAEAFCREDDARRRKEHLRAVALPRFERKRLLAQDDVENSRLMTVQRRKEARRAKREAARA